MPPGNVRCFVSTPLVRIAASADAQRPPRGVLNVSDRNQQNGVTRRDVLRLLSLSAIGGIAGCDARPRAEPVAAFSPQTSACTFEPDVELWLTAAPGEVRVLPGPPTRVWRFTGRLFKGPADTLQASP